jgi:transposase
VILAVLLYAYCVGERSSRGIGRRLVEDVAFRVVAANQQPDHATLARFRARHQEAIAGLFAQVLGLCVAEGLVATGVRSIRPRSRPTRQRGPIGPDPDRRGDLG